jgi:RNA polymerase sigma-70 factor (ECF subfamily)
VSTRSASVVLDEYLVVRSQLGDGEAFGGLVRRWHDRLVRHAVHLTGDDEAARDIAQESWVGIVRGLGSLRDPASFRPWALRIVSNKARDWVRRERTRRRAVRAAEASAARTPEEAGSESVAEEIAKNAEREAIARVRAGLEELEPDQRLILGWHYLDGMSVREIAAALQVPPGTVKSRLYTLRQALRRRLEET